MSTTSNPAVKRVYDGVTVPNKQLGGIVGDARHAANGGYHIGRNFCPSGDYSVQLVRDKGGDGNMACALDITLDAAGMRLVTGRLLAAAKANDPRLCGAVREFAGTLDNQEVYAYDTLKKMRVYGFDSSHKYHVHISFFRDTAGDYNKIKGVADVINGVSTKKEDDMPAASDVWSVGIRNSKTKVTMTAAARLLDIETNIGGMMMTLHLLRNAVDDLAKAVAELDAKVK